MSQAYTVDEVVAGNSGFYGNVFIDEGFLHLINRKVVAVAGADRTALLPSQFWHGVRQQWEDLKHDVDSGTVLVEHEEDGLPEITTTWYVHVSSQLPFLDLAV